MTNNPARLSSSARSKLPPPLLLLDDGGGTGAAAATLMVTDSFAAPPGPVQDNTYSSEPTLDGVTICAPAVLTLPFQSPAAEQSVAFVDDHDNATLSPSVMLVVLAESTAVGPGTAATVTVTEPSTVPATPLHDKEKVLGPVASGVTVCTPNVAMVPLQAPLATQLVALLDDQVTIEL